MSTHHWNYRLIVTETPFEDDDVDTYGMEVHEVYYHKNGKVSGWTQDPVSFGGNTPTEAASALSHAISDILNYPPLIEREGKLVEWEDKK